MDYIIVQAGGKGTRLGYLTKNKPKALVPVKNLPLLFHLFRKYPEKKFLIIADYQKEVLHEYLAAFADVEYQIVDAVGTGTCSGIGQAVSLIPPGQPFMLIWSDLILSENFELPEEYQRFPKGCQGIQKNIIDIPHGDAPKHDYVGISGGFPCRWSYKDGRFIEEKSTEHGVAGFFLFTDRGKLADVPPEGEFVRWLQQTGKEYKEIGLDGAKEFGTLQEYAKLGQEKCRPFNKVTVEGDIFIKEPTDAQGISLAQKECAWYEKAMGTNSSILPRIYAITPLKMEYIKGENIYGCSLPYKEKKEVLRKIVEALKDLHDSGHIWADTFSIKEAYFNKTMNRLGKIRDLVPFANEKEIVVNKKRCRNVYYHKRELEKKLESLQYNCDRFDFIHGDCTFSNLMLREDGSPVLIDPRGYFGHTKLYGDVRYDWAKLYYSIVGNYDRFNLKDFRLEIKEGSVELKIGSNGWKGMEADFFALTGAKEEEIRLLHAVIWLSLTTYAWQDYDSVCGAFYNGLYYLEDVL